MFLVIDKQKGGVLFWKEQQPLPGPQEVMFSEASLCLSVDVQRTS